MGKVQSIVGGILSRLVVLGSIRKQAEQSMWSNQEAALLYSLCLSSCLQVFALFQFLPWLPSIWAMIWKGKLNKSFFPPTCFWSWCFIMAIINPNWDSSWDIQSFRLNNYWILGLSIRRQLLEGQTITSKPHKYVCMYVYMHIHVCSYDYMYINMCTNIHPISSVFSREYQNFLESTITLHFFSK